MAGVVIAPLPDNYNCLDYDAIRKIYREVYAVGKDDEFNY